jgi:hypothetical protein
MAKPRLWTTDSLQRAVFEPPLRVDKKTGHLTFAAGRAACLYLALADPDYGEAFCCIGEPTIAAAEAWAPGSFDAIVSFDAMDWALRELEGRIRRARVNSPVTGALERRRDDKLIGRAAAYKNLARLLTLGLEARDGAHLSERQQLTYVHILARLDEWRTRWHVCERCSVVFQRRRKMQQPYYYCPSCKGQRPPSLRSASDLQRCASCDAPFSPSDVRQRNCRACQRAKSSRSRHPERTPRPGTRLRRAYVDLDAM